jgi:predicted amino acid racemase
MSAPRLEIDLEAIAHNTRTLVSRLEPLGIGVTGITKASLGSPGVATAMLSGGATGLGDSRVENLARLRAEGVTSTTTLIRSPMVSQAALVVRDADVSLNTEATVIDSLAAAALNQGTTHAVVVMVELGDLREGVPVAPIWPARAASHPTSSRWTSSHSSSRRWRPAATADCRSSRAGTPRTSTGR